MQASAPTPVPSSPAAERPTRRVALLGNPNTGKTTLFNRLCGLRHRTANFPGTTQEARLGTVSEDAGLELVDLPGVYSLELDGAEPMLCRAVLAGQTAPTGRAAAEPDAVCVVVDATNLARNLLLVGEVLRRRLPTVVVVNMLDAADRAGLRVDASTLEERVGCGVVAGSARTGRGLESLAAALDAARVPNRTPPGGDAGLADWAESTYAAVVTGGAPGRAGSRTDRADRLLTHPVLGTVCFGLVMAGLFAVIFRLAAYPMGWIDWFFGAVSGLVETALPAGVLRDLLSQGVVGGIGSTVVFLPQIALLFFLLCLLEDTGYLARAAFVADRWLRPFGLSGHAFVPLLSSHACALPGIMSARAIPDRRERLAAILVAPFASCTARIPVYVLLTTLLFGESPGLAALAFVGCYALGAAAALFSSLVARRTILRGPPRPMALELPTYKAPSLRNAVITAWDRSIVFLRKAGTVILAISIVLWWLSSYPRVDPPAAADQARARAAALGPSSADAAALLAEADALETAHAARESFTGRIGRLVEPVFEPLGYDWRLSIGVMASFAAREVFVATMSVVVAGAEDDDPRSVLDKVRDARRDDGRTPLFTPAVSWSLLVYYVLAMQCLPTLAVTAREAGGARWALLQFAWMTALAYGAALGTFQLLSVAGAGTP